MESDDKVSTNVISVVKPTGENLLPLSLSSNLALIEENTKAKGAMEEDLEEIGP